MHFSAVYKICNLLNFNDWSNFSELKLNLLIHYRYKEKKLQ